MAIITSFDLTDQPVTELRNGELAIITQWGSLPSYIGKLIHRVGDNLNTVGENSEHSWGNGIPWKDGMQPKDENIWRACRVRKFKKGESVTIKF